MGKDYEKTFTVSGWYEGDPVIGASQVYLSKVFWDKISEGYTEEDFVEAYRHTGLGIGLIQGNIVFQNSRHIEDNIIKIIEGSGYSVEDIDYGINWAYFTEKASNIDGVTLVIVLFALFIMMLTGYLIIYNIFQISVIHDIRYYGLLKTIGATKKQIKRLIRRQALVLSCLGIPLGLLLGYVVGNQMMPILLRMASSGVRIQNFHLKPNPYIFLFGGLFSVLTVFISCRKPGKIAGSVTSIEASKFTDANKKKFKNKKTVGGAKLYRMALSNMARNKRKTWVVILSMSLSVILLTEVVTMTKGFRLDKYLEGMLTGDFMIHSISLTHYDANYELTLKEDFYEEVRKQEGIESMNRMYHSRDGLNHTLTDTGRQRFQQFYEEGKLTIYKTYPSNLPIIEDTINNNGPIKEQRFAYDEPLLGKLKVLEGEIDLEKFRTGKYVIVGSMLDEGGAYYDPGDKINLSFHGPDSKQEPVYDETGNAIIDYVWENDDTRIYEVMAVVDIPYSMTERRFALNALTTILPVDELQKYDESAECFAASVNVKDDKEAAIQSFLENYTTTIDPNTEFQSKEGLRDEFTSLTGTISLVGGALSLVIAIIGILNFINTMLTSVITRRHEFAMLQSIGLTNTQLKKMLLYEGLYYVGFTAGISIAFGSLLSVGLIRALNNIVLYFEYQFIITPYIGVIPVFVVVAFVTPIIAYYKVKDKSIVERLREIE